MGIKKSELGRSIAASMLRMRSHASVRRIFLDARKPVNLPEFVVRNLMQEAWHAGYEAAMRDVSKKSSSVKRSNSNE